MTTTTTPVPPEPPTGWGIWRPFVPDSIDGLPLATSLSDLWTEFPYDRIPPGSVGTLVRPEAVLQSMILFVVSLPLLKALVQWQTRKQPDSRQLSTTQNGHSSNNHHSDSKSSSAKSQSSSSVSWLQVVTAIHNFILAVFSLICAYQTYALTAWHVQQYGVWNTYCDPHRTFWNQAGMGPWNVIFYLSKFYELADTWLLLLRRKPATFLQVYHHAMMIAAMWGGVVAQAPWLFIVVALNSVIHTLMYTYFLVKTLWPKMHIAWAKYLTLAQIAQFFTGIFVSLPHYYVYARAPHLCPSTTSSGIFTLALFHLYGLSLIVLFTAFAHQKYNKHHKTAKPLDQTSSTPHSNPTKTPKLHKL